MKCRECTHCFYCDRELVRRHEHDHFPLPKRHGGQVTVPACLDCHDLKDRLRVADWNASEAIVAFQQMPREGRLLLSKVLSYWSDVEAERAAA